MSLRVGLLTDPLEKISIETDSSFLLAKEAQKRGYKLFYFLPDTVSLQDGRLYTKAHSFIVRDHFIFQESCTLNLKDDLDIVLMRQNPGKGSRYDTLTFLFESIHPDTLVINDPAAVRNSPEKLLITRFPHLMPPTLITSDVVEITAFRKAHQDIVIKPLYEFGGAGVFRVRPDDDNLLSLLEMMDHLYGEAPLVIQKYLPAIQSEGDKRIILVNGLPKGAFLRRPVTGTLQANLRFGAQAEKTILTEKEQEICAELAPELKKNGLLFSGIDVIGGYVTEINVTSPTGLPAINRLSNTCLQADIWDAIEEKYTETRIRK